MQRAHCALAIAAIAIGLVSSSSSSRAAAQELSVHLSETGAGARVGLPLGERTTLGVGLDGMISWSSGAAAFEHDTMWLPLELHHRLADVREARVVPTLGFGAAYAYSHSAQGDAEATMHILQARAAVGAEYWAGEAFAIFAEGGCAVARAWTAGDLGNSKAWFAHTSWRLGTRFRF
jgi:hypothetical protein